MAMVITKQTPSSPEGLDLLTVRQVAEMLQMHVEVVRRWIRCGKLEAVDINQLGRRPEYRVQKSAIIALLHPTIHD